MLRVEDLDRICLDWRDRETWACGPGPMLDGIDAHFAVPVLGQLSVVESWVLVTTLRSSSSDRPGTTRTARTFQPHRAVAAPPDLAHSSPGSPVAMPGTSAGRGPV